MRIMHDPHLSIRDHRLTRTRSASSCDGGGSTLSWEIYKMYIEQGLEPLDTAAELRHKLRQGGSNVNCLEIEAVGAPHERRHKSRHFKRLSGERSTEKVTRCAKKSIQRIPHFQRQASIKDVSTLQTHRAELGTGANRVGVLWPMYLNVGSRAPSVDASRPQNVPHALSLRCGIFGLLHRFEGADQVGQGIRSRPPHAVGATTGR